MKCLGTMNKCRRSRLTNFGQTIQVNLPSRNLKLSDLVEVDQLSSVHRVRRMAFSPAMFAEACFQLPEHFRAELTKGTLALARVNPEAVSTLARAP